MPHHLRTESPLLHVAVIAHTTSDRRLCALHHLRMESPLLHVKVTTHAVGDRCVYTRLPGSNKDEGGQMSSTLAVSTWWIDTAMLRKS
ncbi:hypothetical protein B296_00039395 [Ensete ventricosum]|uniref:Uncharacterized protein n=1 Tax=Ensete ventricosum TaxID=4639 RepID=A0A426YHV5_ENSVE|nr:hypothetical protein B296_00039395 [Ensete ventricosum]